MSTIATNFKTALGSPLIGVLTLFTVVALVLVGCSDTVVNEEGSTTSTDQSVDIPPPEDFDAVATLSGRVIDRVTSEPIAGVDVTVDADGADGRSAVTEEDGSFRIANLPATTRSDERASGSYTVHIVTNNDSYREAYTASVQLEYGKDEGGSGAPNNLGASVIFPLSKVTGQVTGSISNAVSDLPVTQGEVRLYQTLDLRYDQDNNAVDTDRVKVGTFELEDGSFAFDRVEESASYQVAYKAGEGFDEQLFPRGSLGATRDGDASEEQNVTISPNGLPPFTAELTPGATGDSDSPTQIESTTPEWTLTFNRPLAGAEDLTADAIEDAITVTIAGDREDFLVLGDGDSFPIEAEIVSAQEVRFAITDDVPLSDGTEIKVEIDRDLLDLFDAVFGSPLDEVVGLNPDQTSSSTVTITYVIGENQEAPGAPSFERIDDEEFDYTDSTVAIDFSFDFEAEDVPLRRYEVFARTAADGVTTGGNFRKVDEIDVRDVEFGDLEESATFSGFPFVASDGSYGPIEWQVRAVSINGVTGPFSEVQTIEDEIAPTVEAEADHPFAEMSDLNPDQVRVRFSEALNRGSATDPANYTVVFEADTVAVTSVALDNQTPRSHNPLTSAVLTLEEEAEAFFNITVNVEQGVTDLAGNAFSDEDNEAFAEREAPEPPAPQAIADVDAGDADITDETVTINSVTLGELDMSAGDIDLLQFQVRSSGGEFETLTDMNEEPISVLGPFADGQVVPVGATIEGFPLTDGEGLTDFEIRLVALNTDGSEATAGDPGEAFAIEDNVAPELLSAAVGEDNTIVLTFSERLTSGGGGEGFARTGLYEVDGHRIAELDPNVEIIGGGESVLDEDGEVQNFTVTLAFDGLEFDVSGADEIEVRSDPGGPFTSVTDLAGNELQPGAIVPVEQQ